VELASCSFGQSSKVSYLQMANAVAAIVNGGNLMRPYLVEEVITAEGKTEEKREPETVRRALQESTSLAMRQMMEEVVLLGGGRNAYVAGYRVGGKSGTSQKLDSPDEKARIGSFVGVAPIDDPQVVVLVCLDEPHSYSALGGTISAPVVAEVLEKTLEYLGVPRQYNAQEQQRLEAALPDVTGKSPAAAAKKLEELGFGAKIMGEGERVLSQYPAAGEQMPRASTVLLYTAEGQEKQTVLVPALEGQSPAQAAAALCRAGLNIKAAGPTQSGAAKAAWQSAPAGASLPAGSLVEVRFFESDPEGD